MHEDLDVFGFDMSLEDVSKAKKNFKEFDESSINKSCSFMHINQCKICLTKILLSSTWFL